MRKGLRFSAVTGLALLVVAGVAFGAHALAGRTYAGTGQEYENNGPHLQTSKGFTEHMSLTVSTDGTRVEHFKGYYVYYCGAGKSYVDGNKLKISPAGRFGGVGSQATSNGTSYFVLRGRFIDGGQKAAITYQATFVSRGQTAPHPYSLAYQPSPACQNKVSGTIAVK
jgi:hypothetical protein